MQMTVRRPRRLRGDVTPPGDKSISHRAAIFNAIADGEARVENYGTGADLPTSVAGTFGAANTAGDSDYAGAFGAHRQNQ